MAANIIAPIYDGTGIHLREFGINMTLADFLTDIEAGGARAVGILDHIVDIGVPLTRTVGRLRTFITGNFNIPAITDVLPVIPATIEQETVIGRGGFGIVGIINIDGNEFAIKAQDLDLSDHYNTTLAIKESVINYLLYRDHYTRPHVCGIYRVLRYGTQQLYFIMEKMSMAAKTMLMDSRTFRTSPYEPLALHTIHFVLEIAQRFESLRQICDYAHGDFKPDNVMLSPQGCYRLIDFGFSSMRIRTENGEFHIRCNPALNNGENSECRNLGQLFTSMRNGVPFDQRLDELGDVCRALELVHPIIRDIPNDIKYAIGGSWSMAYRWYNDHHYGPTTDTDVVTALRQVLTTLRGEGRSTDRIIPSFMTDRGVRGLMDHSEGLQHEALPVGLVAPARRDVSRNVRRVVDPLDIGMVMGGPAVRQVNEAPLRIGMEPVRMRMAGPIQPMAVDPRRIGMEPVRMRMAGPIQPARLLPARQIVDPQEIRVAAELEAENRVPAPPRKYGGNVINIPDQSHIYNGSVLLFGINVIKKRNNKINHMIRTVGKGIKLKYTLKKNKYTKKYNVSTQKRSKKYTSSRKRVKHRRY